MSKLTCSGISDRRSESPRVQQLILHQKLREEIEKSSVDKLRYIDSELHFRNKEFTRTSEGSNNNHQGSAQHINSQLSTTPTKRASGLEQDLKFEDALENDSEVHQIDSNCHVCLIKEVRQNFDNINKLVKEQNEQLSKLRGKLKAESLRSYFQKQMTD